MSEKNGIICLLVLGIVVIALVMFDVKIATAQHLSPVGPDKATSLAKIYCSDDSLEASVKLEKRTRERANSFKQLDIHTTTDKLLAELINMQSLVGVETLSVNCAIWKAMKQGEFLPILGDSEIPEKGGMIPASIPPAHHQAWF